MHIRYRLSTALLLWAVVLVAQNNSTLPPSLLPENSNFPAPPAVVLKKPDLEQLRAEDAAQTQQARFAAPISTFITTQNAGVWVTLPDSTKVWRCAISAPDALALILLFEKVVLPEGGKLYAYDAAQSRIRGPYTKEHLGPTGRFTIGTLPGSEVILEYHAPPFSKGEETIEMNRVDYAYQKALLAEEDPWAASGFGSSLACHVNINCAAAANWQTEKRGIARILMIFSGGSAWCSGSLIANTANTGVPYFLTAHHCQILLTSPQFDQWTFDFNYEFNTCSTGPEPAFQTVIGCTRLAFRMETDFMLLRLNPVPSGFSPYFNGWTRSASPATASTFIHHPQGDVKKFSADSGPAENHGATINWGPGFGISPVNTHWKVTPDQGIYEPGSSGCPMFNVSKKIVGQLHGGSANGCTVFAAYFGMFHKSWDGVSITDRLRDYLDPNNTNLMEMNGYVPTTPHSISGNVKSWWGVNMPNVRVALSGTLTDTVTTDGQGNYIFPSLPPGGSYTIKPLTKDLPLNGVSAYDLILVSRHILNLEPLTDWKLIAADVNESGTVTTFDNVESRKVILGSVPNFPFQKSWRYFLANATFPNPANPFANMPESTLTFNNLTQNITGANFFGVKVGDVDNSSDPGQ
jgi:lysyl endopeptidase